MVILRKRNAGTRVKIRRPKIGSTKQYIARTGEETQQIKIIQKKNTS
jgi:hypothetical protein